MNLQELRNKPREWKVIDNTYYSEEYTGIKVKKMIGDIFEECRYSNYDKTVTLWNKDKSGFWTFRFSDLQEMTPLEYNGVRIGIGDEVKYKDYWSEVYGYTWYDGKWQIFGAREKGYEDTFPYQLSEISGHKPLHSKKEPLELTLDQVAEKFGVEAVKIKK